METPKTSGIPYQRIHTDKYLVHQSNTQTLYQRFLKNQKLLASH